MEGKSEIGAGGKGFRKGESKNRISEKVKRGDNRRIITKSYRATDHKLKRIGRERNRGKRL